jgi:hypothetical protein
MVGKVGSKAMGAVSSKAPHPGAQRPILARKAVNPLCRQIGRYPVLQCAGCSRARSQAQKAWATSSPLRTAPSSVAG